MRERGFTLMEMIAVLVVIGLLLAFSPMALDFLVAEKELESEVARFATMIDLTRSQAILDRAPYAIHVDTEKARWAVQIPVEVEQQTRDPDAVPKKVLVLDENVDERELEWHDLPRDFALEFWEGRIQHSGSYSIRYSPDGTVPPHAIVIESKKVSSLDEDDRIRTLRVNFPGLVSFAVGRAVEDFKLTEAELGR
jgi:prepilin-type N-terminal cleavage/methylation domain-containing protein